MQDDLFLNNDEIKEKPTKPCLAPLTSLYVTNYHQFKPCCWFRNKEDPMHVEYHKSPLKTPISDYREKILFPMYEEMKKGNWSKGCRRCMLPGKKRLQTYEHHRTEHGIDNLENNKKILQLDLRFSILCNLGCIMCDAGSSDQFWKHEEQGKFMMESNYRYGRRTRPQKNFVKNTKFKNWTWHEDEDSMQEIIDLLPNLEVIYMTGGEPSINPGVHRIMEHCIKHGYNKNIRLEFNTNCTNANPKFVELLSQFKTDLMFSIDAYGSLNDIIRFPSNFKTLERNIIKLIEAQTAGKSYFCPSIHVYNFFKTHELVEWMEGFKERYDNVTDTYYNIIFDPFYMNIANIPEEHFNKYMQEHGYKLPEKLRNSILNKKHPHTDKGYDWNKIKDVGKKWFESRKGDFALTGIPNF